MKLKIQPSFERDTRKSPKQIVFKLKELLDAITNAQNLTEIPNVKKLAGYKNAYRIRLDDFRVGFILEGEVVILVRLLSRKDVYKYFP